jgi:hypothetical protein
LRYSIFRNFSEIINYFSNHSWQYGSQHVPIYTVSVMESYCSCLGNKLHGACCHLIAASRLPGVGSNVQATAWAGMADDTELSLVQAARVAPPRVEPLSDDMLIALSEMHGTAQPQQVPADVQLHNGYAESVDASIRSTSQSINQLSVGMPDAMKHAIRP